MQPKATRTRQAAYHNRAAAKSCDHDTQALAGTSVCSPVGLPTAGACKLLTVGLVSMVRPL